MSLSITISRQGRGAGRQSYRQETDQETNTQVGEAMMVCLQRMGLDPMAVAATVLKDAFNLIDEEIPDPLRKELADYLKARGS